MKKLILSLAIILLSVSGFGQYMDEYFKDCGRWVEDTIILTEWKVIDTINYNSEGDTNYIYSEWLHENINYYYVDYCHCGCGYDKKEYMDRICGLGIIERMYRITKYKYIPKPKSAFGLKLEELKQKNK